MNGFPVLTILTFLPFAGALAVSFLRPKKRTLARGLALGFSLGVLALTLLLWAGFNTSAAHLQFEESYVWIPSLAVRYHLGIDGLGLLMLLLSAIVVPMAMLASWHIQERAPLYFGLVLFLQTGLIGTFTALNFFHWFLFWELSLIPAFFLIRLWGGPLRVPAATQFFIYTMAGSVALLLGFLAIFFATGKFDFMDLAQMGRDGTLVSALADKLGWTQMSSSTLALVIFFGVFLGLAVKVPIMPFHTWLPAAYAEAPTGTSMLLTGVMSKMGLYGFLRILLPVFPGQLQWMRTPLLWLAVITIIFSASSAFAQRDLKRVLAYSSINHLGYCLLGIFAVMGSGALLQDPQVEKAAALNGVFLQMFNHGLTAASLFWFAGFLERRGGGLRGLDDFGGLRRVAPVFCGLMGIALFASLGLPGLNGFVSEFLIFKGAFPLSTWATGLAAIGLLITAVFILSILQRVFNGPLNVKWSTFSDLSITERLAVLPALGLMLILGIYPQLLLGMFNSTVLEMVSHLRF